MKFGVYEKHVAIVTLYKCGMMAKMIFQVLKPPSVNERFVPQTLAHYQETRKLTHRCVLAMSESFIRL